ncbi:RNA 2'-phosphotransferase [Leucothrix arctica]|uniref:Probable RNA 2'-phosphotransferase n=1 Tax=Leucothrix arctica TaxID=1481894 RepID=A0A317CIV1_9GAMM|nr:RNA 2'-phosphotransferase [Leucothrix arctica]PWQ98426.1 RNA 2'-phosphotransferase [Leucothrix arctica]
MNEKQIKNISKFLSLVLRHDPIKANLSLDTAGWTSVSELLTNLEATRYSINLEQLKEVVDNNDKKRFQISDDCLRIRASQGHSINIDLQLTPKEPPAVLFHGTATRFVDSINLQGLKAGSRNHVHLSTNVDTALAVGQRYGKPVLLKVDAQAMYEQGVEFYLSENGVWLTEHVSPNFISNA